MSFLIGALTGLAAGGGLWMLNELRWSWRITQEVHEYDDPDDQILSRFHSNRRH